MKFGPVPVAEALGATLAHSLQFGSHRLRKGRLLSADDLDMLRSHDVDTVVVASFEPDDLSENEAAARIGAALAPDPDIAGLRLEAPFTGRVNLIAARDGVLVLAADAIRALNAVDPAITLATLAQHKRVSAGDMLATIKIIPYAVPNTAVERALGCLNGQVVKVHARHHQRADLVLTRTAGMGDKLMRKGETAVSKRLTALGVTLGQVIAVDHEEAAVADALRRSSAPLVLILGGSATSDARDVCPAGLVAAGGRMERFGMPVDPGNLLFLGKLGERDVIGLPGCARSPALNGADWVLERVVSGIPVTSEDIADMGIGGLLKEIPTRPQPRAFALAEKAGKPKVAVILLAAGASRRMGGRDKLMETIDDVPLLRRTADRMIKSSADSVIVVLPPDGRDREEVLQGLEVQTLVARDAALGMSASLRAGVLEAANSHDAVILAFADMPDIEEAQIDRLIAAFDPKTNALICRSVTAGGVPGQPVLFGKRFFGALCELTGDLGAREIVRGAGDYLVDVPDAGDGPVIDLDTPEAWEAYLADRSGQF